MPKAKQHFVPRVYLKRWAFQGKSVYYFNRSELEVGEKRNVDTILYNRHAYTVNMNEYFILDYLPEIRKDFYSQISQILDKYKVSAFCDGAELNSEDLIIRNLGKLDEWEFRSQNCESNSVKTKAIIGNLNEVRSYIIETSLDDFVEKKWNNILDEFIDEVEKGFSLRFGTEDINIQEKTVEDMIAVLLMFMCRNPKFDCNGIFPNIEETLQNIFNQDDEKEEIDKYIKGQMRGAWLVQIYKALYNDDISFFSSFFNRIRENCQVTVIKCPETVGSFLTSDNPAFSYINNVSAKNYNALYFPLTPNYLLMVGRGDKNSLSKIDVRVVTNDGVKHFNKIILSKAYEGIVANRKYIGFII